MLTSSGIPHLEILASRFQSYHDDEYRLKLINDGNYAILVKALDRTYTTNSENLGTVSKRLVCLQECLTRYYLMIALQVNSPYKQLFDKKISQLVESGIIDHWLQAVIVSQGENYISDFFQRRPFKSHRPQPLSLKHMAGAFHFLVLGNSFAVIAFAAEKLLKYI